jgi:hypothetical protein
MVHLLFLGDVMNGEHPEGRKPRESFKNQKPEKKGGSLYLPATLAHVSHYLK